jgi:hypothetical protein
MNLKDIISRIGFSNFLSIVSFFMSLTCFAMLARVSQDYSKKKLNTTQPIVVNAQQEELKITDGNAEENSVVYDNVLSDIDKFIQNVPEKVIANSDEKLDVTYKMVDQHKQTKKNIQQNNAKTEGIAPVDNVVISNSKETTRIKEQQPEEIVASRVRLGVFNTYAEAVSAWFRLRKAHYSILDGLQYKIENKTEANKKRYVLFIDTQSNLAAKKMCNEFKTHKITCTVLS